MVTLLSNYAKDGMTVVILQATGNKMQYVVDNIAEKKSHVVTLAKELPAHLLEEVKSVSELVWPTNNEYILNRFRPISDELKTFIYACWKEMASKEACLAYMAAHFQGEISGC